MITITTTAAEAAAATETTTTTIILITTSKYLVEARTRGRARCSFVVRAFAHGAMGHRIDPSWWTH